MDVIFEPIPKYIQQLDAWLYDEKNKGISKTYYNFTNADFTINNFACLVNENDECIGYIQYNFCDKYSSIDIAIIKKEYQKKGLGKLLLDKVTEALIERGTFVLKLYCEPHSSKRIWKKLGFKEFKEIENHRSLKSKDYQSPWLYKTIVPVLKPIRKKNIEKKIELWTIQEHLVKLDDKPNYVWDVTTFQFPVVYPADDDWKIRFSINNKVKYEGRLKWFMNGFYFKGDFLIIDKNN